MPVVDIEASPERIGSKYSPPFDTPCQSMGRRKLGNPAGLTQFGVNLLRLPPGAWSSQRHWHAAEDEFVFVVSGQVVLVDDAGEHLLCAGECAGFPAADRNGHHLQNRSAAEAIVLEIGSKRPEADNITYPDIGMFADADGMRPSGATPGAVR